MSLPSNKPDNIRRVFVTTLLTGLLIITPTKVLAISKITLLNIGLISFYFSAQTFTSLSAGFNLGAVSNDVNFDECKNETLPDGTYDLSNCLLSEWSILDFTKVSTWAMLGTAIPSGNCLFWCGYGIAKLVGGIRQAIHPDETATRTEAGLFALLIFLKLSGAGYYAVRLGEGDQEGAANVGRAMGRARSFNRWCEDHPEQCVTTTKASYLDSTAPWRNYTNVDAGEEYWANIVGRLNRYGSASVGFAFGYSVIDAVMFGPEYALYRSNVLPLHLLPSLQGATKLVASSTIVEIELGSKFTEVAESMDLMSTEITQKIPTHYALDKHLLWLEKARFATTLPVWLFMFWDDNPVTSLGAPIFNSEFIANEALGAVNNSDIVFNHWGVMYHKDDPNATFYEDDEQLTQENALEHIPHAVQYLIDNHYITPEIAAEMQTAQQKAGAGKYKSQYQAIVSAGVANIWQYPSDIIHFKQACQMSTVLCYVDIIWAASAFPVVALYDWNLFTFLESENANKIQSINAVYKSLNNESYTADDLLFDQKKTLGINMFFIDLVFLSKISPKVLDIKSALNSPVFPTAAP